MNTNQQKRSSKSIMSQKKKKFPKIPLLQTLLREIHIEF